MNISLLRYVISNDRHIHTMDEYKRRAAEIDDSLKTCTEAMERLKGDAETMKSSVQRVQMDIQKCGKSRETSHTRIVEATDMINKLNGHFEESKELERSIDACFIDYMNDVQSLLKEREVSVGVEGEISKSEGTTGAVTNKIKN